MNKNSLLHLLRSTISNVDPVFLLKSLPRERFKADAYLFLGKASVRFWEGLEALELERDGSPRPILGVYPRGASSRVKKPGCWIAAEHPLPGEGSFRAGHELLEFFDSLRRLNARSLTVFLSGGASSLIWLPKAGMSHAELLEKLRVLYRAGLDIGELNERRSKLCQLKAGGAARWLSHLAPRVRPRVFVLSDVAPLGPEIVGSGPFWNGKVPHRVLADNSTWVKALAKEARGRRIPVLHSSSGRLGTWQSWVQTAIQEVAPALRENRKGIVIFGGEPSVRLPAPKGAKRSSRQASGRGGRETHLALALAHDLRPWMLQGKIEILAMSSDGSDGNSGAAGAWLDSEKFPKRLASVSKEQVQKALREYRSASLLSKLGGLVKPDTLSPRSNVQDVLMIRVL